jgi:hypothetical protein
MMHNLKIGWLANNLLSPEQVTILASTAGLHVESFSDLSAMLRLNRPRDRFIHRIMPLVRPFMNSVEYCRFLVGGDARQQAYRSGLLQYGMIVFVKP